jgi:hypothetical protein
MINPDNSITDPEAGVYRIGAVARLTSIPVTTLRVWESRYSAFRPVKTQGGHRLYSDSDVKKAGFLKLLTGAGHAISSVAGLDMDALLRMVHESRSSSLYLATRTLKTNSLSMAVVGLGMASRIEAKKFTRSFSSHAIRLTDVFTDLPQALGASLHEHPQILLVRLGSLQASTPAELSALLAKHQIVQAILIYSYAHESIVEAIKKTGVIVRREPISDDDLSDLLRSILIMDAANSVNAESSQPLIPERKYSDETLARVASISTNVLCECPKHVAELISQLSSFEQYSKDCLNSSPEDTHLHAYLSSVSGSARALFERALEMVATHEGISLEPIANRTSF